MLVRERSPSTNMAQVPTSPDKPTFLYSNSVRNHRQGVLQLNRYLFIYLFIFYLYYLRHSIFDLPHSYFTYSCYERIHDPDLE